MKGSTQRFFQIRFIVSANYKRQKQANSKALQDILKSNGLLKKSALGTERKHKSMKKKRQQEIVLIWKLLHSHDVGIVAVSKNS